MDPLTALRSAVMEGREKEVSIVENGSVVLICGVPYPALSETAFKVQRSARSYKLLSLWLQYVARDKNFPEMVKIASTHKLSLADVVLVVDKRTVLDYLTGSSAALGHIDNSMLSTTGAEAAAAGVSTRPWTGWRARGIQTVCSRWRGWRRYTMGERSGTRGGSGNLPQLGLLAGY